MQETQSMVDVTTYSEARQTLAKLMDRVVKDNEPVIVARKRRGSVVLVSLAEWNSLQEALHLVSTRANARALLDAINDLNAGKGVDMSPEKLEAIGAKARTGQTPGRGSNKSSRGKRVNSGAKKRIQRRIKKIHREAAE
jgi:antitoxin YefM